MNNKGIGLIEFILLVAIAAVALKIILLAN